MKTQIQVLQEWKTGWEADKAEVKEKNEQARQVVTELRADIAKKDAKIEQLNNKLKEVLSTYNKHTLYFVTYLFSSVSYALIDYYMSNIDVDPFN